MKMKQLAIALLCGTMIAAPAFAQTSSPPAGQNTAVTTTGGRPAPYVPAGIGSSPNGMSSTTRSSGGLSTNASVPAAQGSTPVGQGPVMTTTGGTPSSTMAMPAMSMTNINTAAASDLDKLPQIGRSRAARIIKMRPYASTDELVSKKVLPMSVYNRIKSQISAS